MDGPHLFSQASVADRPPLVHELAAAVMAGHSALITGPVGTEELFEALAGSLAATRTRVLRVRPPLDLPDFMEQVAPPNLAGGDLGLVQGFNALTMPDPACDRIVLLVEGAHLLPQPTLRYIELALRAGPYLQVAFAGRSEIADTLALDGFAGLRQRLTLHLVLPERIPAPEPLAPAPAVVPAVVPAGRANRRPAILAGVAVMAGLVVAGWLNRPVLDPAAGLDVAGLAVADVGIAPGSAGASPPEPQPSLVAGPDLGPASALAPPAVAAEESTATQEFVPEPDPVPTSNEPQPTIASGDVDAGPELAPPPAPTIAASEPPPEPEPPAGVVPEPALDAPPVSAAVVPTPAAPPQRLAPPHIPPSRPERVAARPSPPRQDDRRCRDIVQRVQLGETPTDGDRTFLRNGCR